MSGFNTESLEWVTDMKERDKLEVLMKNEIRLSDDCFSQLMNLVMCSDPWPCPDEGNQKEIVDLLTIESQLRGYQDWIEAYHKFNPDEVTYE